MRIIKKYLEKIDKNLLLMIYKLSHDVLLLSLITFFISMIAEGILPGFISSHMGFTKITFMLLLVVLATITLGKYLGIEISAAHVKKNIFTPFFLLASFLIIGNTMLKLPLWQNLFFTIIMVAIIYQFFTLSLEDK